MYEINKTNLCLYPVRLLLATLLMYSFLSSIGNLFLQSFIVPDHDKPAVCTVLDLYDGNPYILEVTITPNDTDREPFHSRMDLTHISEDEEDDVPKTGDSVPCFYAAYRSNIFYPSTTESARLKEGPQARFIGAAVGYGLLFLMLLVIVLPICLLLFLPPYVPKDFEPKGVDGKRGSRHRPMGFLTRISIPEHLEPDDDKTELTTDPSESQKSPV